jgi:hypothetical protein
LGGAAGAAFAAGEAKPYEKGPEQAPSWIEVTLLGSQADAIMATVPAKPGPVPVGNAEAGLSLVCFGGADVAVSCAQRYLEAGDRVDPVLQKGVRVTGVLRIGRSPARGAEVALVPKDLRSRRFVTLPLRLDEKTKKLVRTVASDEHGRFHIPQLAPGEYLLDVKLPGGWLHQRDLSVPRREALLPKGPKGAAAEAVLDLGEIAFDEGISFEVFVTGLGGQPVPSARVGALQHDDPERARFFEAVADAGGKAVLTGLEPGEATRVTCVADGYEVNHQSFDAPPAAVGCTLEPLAAIAGQVVDPDRYPVADARITGRFERPAATSRDGRFSLTDLAAGTYELVISAPGFRVERLSVGVAAGEKKALPPIELTPGREWHGLIRDAATRKPVAGASIVSVEPEGLVNAASGEEGEFAFTADAEQPLHLRATAEGYADAVFEADEAKLDEEKRLVVDLTRGGRIHVTVWDEAASAPCQGCPVNLQQPGGATKRLVTDGRGEALSGALAEGRFLVSLVQERSLGGVVQVQGGGDSRWADVLPGEVTPVHFGERSQTVEVRFRPPVPEGWRLFALSSSGSKIGERLPDGGFRILKPKGGAVTLALSGGEPASFVRQKVVAADDDSPFLELPLPRTSVQGRFVRGEKTAPTEPWTLLSAEGMVQASGLSGPDGSIFVPFLQPGTYVIAVAGKPVRTFRLEPGGEDLGQVALEAPIQAPGN